jgi:hypothetical protein
VSSVNPSNRSTVSLSQWSNVWDASIEWLLVFRHMGGLVRRKKLIWFVVGILEHKSVLTFG